MEKSSEQKIVVGDSLCIDDNKNEVENEYEFEDEEDFYKLDADHDHDYDPELKNGSKNDSDFEDNYAFEESDKAEAEEINENTNDYLGHSDSNKSEQESCDNKVQSQNAYNYYITKDQEIKFSDIIRQAINQEKSKLIITEVEFDPVEELPPGEDLNSAILNKIEKIETITASIEEKKELLFNIAENQERYHEELAQKMAAWEQEKINLELEEMLRNKKVLVAGAEPKTRDNDMDSQMSELSELRSEEEMNAELGIGKNEPCSYNEVCVEDGFEFWPGNDFLKGKSDF